MKKTIAIFLLLAATAGLSFAATAEAEKQFTMMGLEYEETNRIWSESLFFERMREMTGVSFSFNQFTKQEEYQKAKQEAFSAEGQLPDVLFKANLSPEEEMAYIESGQLADLAPLIEEHMPNLSKILSAREDWRRAVTLPSGAIASLPVLRGDERQCVVWINQKWMTALGLQMPETIDGFTDVLRAFRDQDPNGNGKKDEIPLDIIGPWEAKFLLHAFGLTPNDYNLYLNDEGFVRFAPFDPAFFEFVSWLRLAQREGLIGPQAFRGTHAEKNMTSQTNDQKTPQISGSLISIAPYTSVSLESAADYALMPPLQSGGRQVYRRLLTGVGRGAFAVTSACADVPSVLRWADVLYTEEGGRLAFAGQEDVDYHFLSDGTWEWKASGDYYALNEMLSKSIIADETRMPGLEPAGFMRNSEIQAENHVRRQMDKIRPYLADPFPLTWPTETTRENRIAELQAALATCVDRAIANFAMGKIELSDANWQSFLEELHALGADELIALWQEKIR